MPPLPFRLPRFSLFAGRPRLARWAAFSAVMLMTGPAGAKAAGGFDWQTASPESQGLATAKLDAFKDGLAARNTTALLVVLNDRIVYEWYAPKTSAGTKLGSASMAKALIGGMATAAALDDGRIHLDDPAAKFIPQWRADPVRSRITIRELGAHTSGLDDAENNDDPHDTLTGWKGDFWKRPPPPRDPFTLARDVVPIIFSPGTSYSYSNPGIAMLAYAVTASLRDAPQKDLGEYLRVRITRKIGIADREWSAGYGEIVHVDGLPLVAAWGGAAFTARGMARIGRLMLREGDWEGDRVLSVASVHAVSEHVDGTPGAVSIGWWSNRDGPIPKLPHDAYYAAGAGHKLTVVIPSLHAIVVRNGQPLSTTEPYHDAEVRYFFVPMMRALAR